MRKIQFGCGGNYLEGWENHDMDMDVTILPLPYQSNSIDYIYHSHLIEHLTAKEGFLFLKDCHRILKPGGVMRICYPDVIRISEEQTDAYREFLASRGWGSDPVASIILNHGHKMAYSYNVLHTILHALGFTVALWSLNESCYEQLQNIDRHGNAIGEEFNKIESICMEARKPHQNVKTS